MGLANDGSGIIIDYVDNYVLSNSRRSHYNYGGALLFYSLYSRVVTIVVIEDSTVMGGSEDALHSDKT